MSGPAGEVTARVDAAKAILAEFGSALEGPAAADWLEWSKRLAGVAESMIAILRGPAPAVTMLMPDGSAFLTAGDVVTARAALTDARWYRAHQSSAGSSLRYAALARALGDIG